MCVCVEKNSGTIFLTFLICVSLGKEATNANSTLLFQLFTMEIHIIL